MQIASAIAQVSSEMEHAGTATQLASAATTPPPDLREHSVALLGGYNNQWTLRLTRPLRFYFIEDQGTREIIADRMQPQTLYERDQSLPYLSADDYALVARFRDPTIDGWVVVMADSAETERKRQRSSPPALTIWSCCAIAWKRLYQSNLEAILKVSVIEGKTGAPSILACIAGSRTSIPSRNQRTLCCLASSVAGLSASCGVIRSISSLNGRCD